MGSAERELCSAVHPAAACLLTRLAGQKYGRTININVVMNPGTGAACCRHNSAMQSQKYGNEVSLALPSKIVTLPRLEEARVRNTALVFSLSSHNLTLGRNQVLAQGVSL